MDPSGVGDSREAVAAGHGDPAAEGLPQTIGARQTSGEAREWIVNILLVTCFLFSVTFIFHGIKCHRMYVIVVGYEDYVSLNLRIDSVNIIDATAHKLKRRQQ